MRAEELNKFLNKHVKIFTKEKYVFTGKVLEVNESTLTLLDIESQEVTFSLDAINFIKSNGGRK